MAKSNKHKYETTAEDFALFVECAKRYHRELGLTDWCVHYRHEKLQTRPYETILGQCNYSHGDAKSAVITLNTIWGEAEPTKDQIVRTAFHEICHIYFAELEMISQGTIHSPQVQEMLFDKAVHEAIHRLEASLLPRLDLSGLDHAVSFQDVEAKMAAAWGPDWNK